MCAQSHSMPPTCSIWYGNPHTTEAIDTCTRDICWCRGSSFSIIYHLFILLAFLIILSLFTHTSIMTLFIPYVPHIRVCPSSLSPSSFIQLYIRYCSLAHHASVAISFILSNPFICVHAHARAYIHTYITLFGVSFAKLDANEVGLDYSANSLTVDLTQLYSPGVQFLGLGHSFIKFPTVISWAIIASLTSA